MSPDLDLAQWLFEHYPEDIFIPLSKRERDILLTTLDKAPVPSGPERLHAEWARMLAKAFSYHSRATEEDEDDE